MQTSHNGSQYIKPNKGFILHKKRFDFLHNG
jgi:hypothetical protein